MNFYLTFDSNKDDLIDKDEYEAMKIKLSNSHYGDLGEYDLSEDTNLDFGELYDLASSICYQELEQIYKGYVEKFGSIEGVPVAKATEKIG